MPVVRQFEVYYGGFVYPQDGICLVNTGPGLLLSISPYNEASTPLLCCINLSEIESDGHNLQVETLLSIGIIFSPLQSTYHKNTSGQNSATCSIQLLGIYTWKCSAYKNTCSLLIKWHYGDVIMTTMASQTTSLTVVYSTVYSDAYQRKHQSYASLAFVWGIHRDRWIPRTKGQLRGKCFHLMTSSWIQLQ